MNELLDVKPVHLVSLPNVPPPNTVRFGPAAIGLMLNEGLLAFTAGLDSITPATVRLDVGESVPIPTLPNLSSKIVVSPMNELLEVNPVHFVSLPNVPLPITVRLGPAAARLILKTGMLTLASLAAISEKLARLRGCA